MKNALCLLPKLKFSLLGVLALPFLFGSNVVLGQESNFGKLALGPSKTSGTLRGTTGGATSLPAIVSNTDHHNQKCLGFADPKPDHLLVLQQPFENLSIRVRSATTDTTLVVQGPDGTVRCGDDLGSNKNAIIVDQGWRDGTYKIWVGTATPGVRSNYTLLIQPE